MWGCTRYSSLVYHLQWMTVSSPPCVEKQHVALTEKHSIVLYVDGF